jgi:hypothetical protein
LRKPTKSFTFQAPFTVQAIVTLALIIFWFLFFDLIGDIGTRDLLYGLIGPLPSIEGIIKLSVLLIVILVFTILCTFAAKSAYRSKAESGTKVKRYKFLIFWISLNSLSFILLLIGYLWYLFYILSSPGRFLISLTLILYFVYCIIIYILADKAKKAKPGTKVKRYKFLIFWISLCFILLLGYSLRTTFNRIEFAFDYGSCSAPTMRTFQDNLPPDRIAIIETTKEKDMFLTTITKVQKVDGEKIRHDACKIELLPGEHQLVCYVEEGTISPVLPLVFIDEGKLHTLTIRAEAGHIYKVYEKWNNSIFIVDELTGAVVAGIKQE